MNGSHREPTTSAGPDFRKSLTWLALIAIASTPSIAPPTYAESDASRDWIATLDADPVWQSPTTAGVLVVGTVAGIVGLDGATGKPLWRIGDLKDHDVTLEALLPEPYALLRLKKGVRGNVVRVLIDVTTGREVWDSSTFGMTDVYHERYVASLDALLVAGKVDDRKMDVAVDLESSH